MEPCLLNYFRNFLEQQSEAEEARRDSSGDAHGVSEEYVQSNDIWNIAFLVLLTHNPKFYYCYSYPRNGPSGPSIKFDAGVFRQLLYKVLLTYEADQSFCYVISRLVDFDRFRNLDPAQLKSSKRNSLTCRPTRFTIRELKFLIWVLTQERYPKEKVLRFELGEKIREIDYAETVRSNYSLAQWPEESRTFRKTSYFDAGKIRTPNIDERDSASSRVLERFLRELQISNVESTSLAKASSAAHLRSGRPRAGAPLRQQNRKPVQDCQAIPGYSYAFPNLNLNKTVKRAMPSEMRVEQGVQLSEREAIRRRDRSISAETVQMKVGSQGTEPAQGLGARQTKPSLEMNTLALNIEKFNQHSGASREPGAKSQKRELKTVKMLPETEPHSLKRTPTMKTVISLERVISNLKRISFKTKDITTLGELQPPNKMLFDMPAEPRSDLESAKCPCKLCLRVKLRKPRIAIGIKTLANEEAQLRKKPEEVLQFKLSNRLKKASKIRRSEMEIVNPYANKKKSRAQKPKKPHLRLRLRRFESNRLSQTQEEADELEVGESLWGKGSSLMCRR